MRAHENLCIDDLQFDAFCEVLEGSLIEHGLGYYVFIFNLLFEYYYYE